MITNYITPQQLKEQLDQYVIGQEEAKRTLCVAVANHYKTIALQQKKLKDIELDKSNIILAGSTGSGKTLLVRTLARLLDVDKVNLSFTPDALIAIASEAIENKTGARGLRSIMDRVLEDIMFCPPVATFRSRKPKVTIDAKYVHERLLKVA